MWKKIGVAVLSLISTFSVIYALNVEMNAAGTLYNAGGNVTGRIHQAPLGVAVRNAGLKKGDRISTGAKNPYNNNEWIAWQLINNENYTNYANAPITTTTFPATNFSNPEINSWFSMTTRSMTESRAGVLLSDYKHASTNDYGYNSYIDSVTLPNISDTINNALSANTNDAKLFTYRNLTTPYEFTTGSQQVHLSGIYYQVYTDPNVYQKKAYIPESIGLARPAIYPIPSKDHAFSSNYISTTNMYEKSTASQILYFGSDGTIQRINNTFNDSISGGNRVPSANTFAVRMAAYLDVSQTVFGISKGTTSNIAKIAVPTLPDAYTKLYSDAVGAEMKLRIEDAALSNSTQLLDIKNKDGSTIQKSSLNSSVYLDVNAVSGNSADGVNTISALVFNNVGDFIFYKPIETTSGNGLYSFDTSGLPIGTYKIGIVNEVYNESTMMPANSSKISALKSLEIVVPLENLNYMPTHGTNTSDYYVTGATGNVKISEKIGSLSSQGGIGNTVAENGIVYKLQPSIDASHSNDVLQFDIPLTNGKPTLDNGKPIVNANPTSGTFLNSGVYKYRIQAYDANGNPQGAQLNDGTPVSGINPDQGLIIPDITTVVYPHDSQLTYSQEKNPTNNVFYTKTELNALAPGRTVGTSTFANNANISDLQAEGYNIISVELVRPGTTTILTELDAIATAGNINEFQIKKKSGANFTADINFDILLTFQKAGVDTAVIRKSNQKFEVPAGLSFVDPDTSTFLNPSEYVYTYKPGNANEFVIKATDNASPNIANPIVKYCILDTNKVCTSTSSVITFANGASAGTQKVEVSTPGTTDKIVNVRATIEDGSGNIVMASDMEITIHPAKQVLTWEGTNIQSTGNHVIKDNALHNTWSLSLKYDKDPAANNDHISAEIINGITLTDKVITLRDDVVSGTTPAITYTYNPSNGLDNGKVKINGNKLIISGELQDKVTIVASAAAVGDYHESKGDDASTPAVNEDEKAYLVLSVSSKAKVKFTPSYTGDISSTSDEAKGILGLGEVSIDPTTETGYTLAIGTAKQLDKAASTPGNEVYMNYPVSNFVIKTEGNPAKQVLYVASGVSLPPGKYIVEVTGKKGVDEASAKEITIVVEEAEVDASKIKWIQKDKVSDAYANVAGQIDPTTKINTGIQEKTYSNVNGVEGTFYVNVDNKNDTLLTGATVTYSLSTKSTPAVIAVSNSGLVTMKKASQPGDVVYVLATIKKTGYKDLEVELPIKINKAISDFEFVDQLGTPYKVAIPPTNIGDPYIYSPLLDPNSTQSPKEAYSFVKDKKLDVITAKAPDNTNVIISIVDKGASKGNDVLTFNNQDPYVQSNADTATKVCEISGADYASNRTSGCLVQIQHALNKYKGSGSDLGKIIIVAEIAESDNYKAKRLEMPVNIMPAKQTDFDFLDPTLPLDSTTSFTAVTPTFKPTTVNSSTGLIELIVNDPNGNAADTTIISLPITGTNIDYLNGVDYIEYKLLVPKNGPDDEKILTIYAVKQADRDHYESDVKKQDWIIAREGTTRLKTTLSSYENASDPSNIFKRHVTYGDAYFKIEASTPDDNLDPANLPTYTYTIDTTSTDYIETYGTDGDKFRPLKAGSGNQIIVIVTRKQSGQSDITSRVPITIAKRNVKLKIDDITKKSGMNVQSSEYQFTATSDNFITSDLPDIDIEFQCQDVHTVDVSTFSDGVRMIHDQLPITVNIKNKVPTKDVLANYTITYLDGITAGIEQGKLIVTEDESLNSWYTIKPGKIDPTTDTKLGLNGWYNGPVDVELNAVAGSYDQISLDDKVGTWSATSATTSLEGNNKHNIYFRKSVAPEEGAITNAKEEIIKIDSIAPEVIDIKATITHNDAFSKLINTITFGIFMKPGEEVTISTKDVQGNPAISVSTTNSITDGITYNVYTIDANANRDKQIVTNGKLDTDATGTGVFNLAKPDVYEICAIVEDQATNSSAELCKNLLVKKINIDVDGDGTNDYLDPDDDGCPDIDIVLTDKKGDFYKLNVDRDKDNIPDMNVDSSGDGLADINVDTDKDGKPDLNLVVITKDMWKPTFCVTTQSDEYCTTQNIKPTINVDTGTDGIPDINIDNVGDFKAHLNISTDGKTPALNIVKFHDWKPDTDYKKDIFAYDSIVTGQEGYIPILNIDTDNDGFADVSVDTNGDDKPDINIDIDGDFIPDLAIDSDGDGLPDMNIDVDGNGTPDENIFKIEKWIPELNGKKDGKEFDTMEIKGKDVMEDNGVKVEKPNGGFFLPNYSIKVNDVTESLDADIKKKVDELAKDQDIKQVLDVSMWKDDTQIQPDGMIRVKIPINADFKNPQILIEQKDKTFKKISGEIVDGYFVYDTDYLGKVSIIADEEAGEPDPIPDPTPDGDDKIPTTKYPDTSVKGSYANSGMGGAGTGDSKLSHAYFSALICSGVFLIHHVRKNRNKSVF